MSECKEQAKEYWLKLVKEMPKIKDNEELRLIFEIGFSDGFGYMADKSVKMIKSFRKRLRDTA